MSDLVKGVARLSELYARRRQDLSAALLRDPLLRQAYLIYYFPANLAKIKSILHEIWAHPAAPSFLSPNPRILDLGCGPGTHTIGFLDFWVNHPLVWQSLEGTAVDSVCANLQESQTLFARKTAIIKEIKPSARSRLRTAVADLTRLDSLHLEGNFDFIVVGNVLNELFRGQEWLNDRYELVSSVVNRWLAPRGFLILLEPALRETSRQLHQLRDRLLAFTELKVYSPCVHNGPCPAVSLKIPKDWCHEDRPWNPPEVIRKVDSLIGNRMDSLKFSYAIFSRLGVSVRDARFCEARESSSLAVSTSARIAANDVHTFSPQGDERRHAGVQGGLKDLDVWRVVSEVMEEKGKAFVFLCGECGRWKVTRLNKHESSANQSFLRLDRGQVVRTDRLKILCGQEARVEPETLVSIKFSQKEEKV